MDPRILLGITPIQRLLIPEKESVKEQADHRALSSVHRGCPSRSSNRAASRSATDAKEYLLPSLGHKELRFVRCVNRRGDSTSTFRDGRVHMRAAAYEWIERPDQLIAGGMNEHLRPHQGRNFWRSKCRARPASVKHGLFGTVIFSRAYHSTTRTVRDCGQPGYKPARPARSTDCEPCAAIRRRRFFRLKFSGSNRRRIHTQRSGEEVWPKARLAALNC